MKIALLIVFLLRFGAAATFYHANYTVTATEFETNSVVMEAEDGNIWAFYGVDEYKVGDRVAALMLDPGTPDDITDDIIVSVRYTG